MKSPFMKSILMFLIWYFLWLLFDNIVSKLNLSDDNQILISVIGLITIFFIMNNSYKTFEF
jgi:hypothetical protein